VLVVRHAAPVPAVVGSLSEIDNGRGLSDEGRRAAADLAMHLHAVPITAIYSSPYRRAIETVEPLAGRLKLQIGVRNDLAERWLADRILEDEEWLDTYRRTWDDIDFSPAGGEPRRATQDRALAALEDLRRRHAGETVVVSSHGGLIGCLLHALDGDMAFEHALEIPMPAVFALTDETGEWRESPLPPTVTAIEVREARSADVPAIADLSLRSRRVARRDVYADDYLAAMTIGDAEAAALGCLQREGWRTWVAELNGRIAAYATAGPWSEDRTGKTADIDDLYVDPEQFRQGIGSYVLRHVEGQVVAEGHDTIVLWVRDGDGGVEAFYSAQGFRAQEQTKDLVKDRSRRFRLWRKAVSGAETVLPPSRRDRSARPT
jgi:2,3-bisphosphoglycerate-dependent phosphoglycerate mutase